MLTATRLLFNGYTAAIAQLNGLDPSYVAIPGEIKQFNVSPNIEQKLQAKLAVVSTFMSMINIVPVVEQQGARVGVGITRSLASRTNRSLGHRRTPTDPTGSESIDQYFCKKTDYDYAWSYATLDAWSHRPEFQQLCRDAVIVQKASDVITIGFNGINAAAETDRTANPLLQDVNWGWLYKMRTYAPSRVLSDGGLTTTGSAIYVADTPDVTKRDYVNLDALVMDARQNLLHERFRGATDLVVIVGSDLVHDKYFNIVNKAGDTATEQVARDVILSSKMLGGLPPVQVPFFPANAIMITRLKNLSYYWQIGSARRAVKDEAALDQIENYESINDAFMVEEYGAACLVENIVLGQKPA